VTRRIRLAGAAEATRRAERLGRGAKGRAATAIAAAKTFDYATSCLADNAVVAEASVYAPLLERLVANGGYLCGPEEKEALERAIWPDGGEIPALAVIAKPASRIAQLAGFAIPADAHSAATLQVPDGAPLLMLERLTSLGDGRPVDLEYIRMRGDRITMRGNLIRSKP